MNTRERFARNEPGQDARAQAGETPAVHEGSPAAYSHSKQMRLAVTILALAILLVIPIAVGITTEVVCLTPPPHLAVAHPSHAFSAQPLPPACSTALRAPPLGG